MSSLSPDKALIFRITHIANVEWILDHGLHCRNSKICDPNYRQIGNPELIENRSHRKVSKSPGGTLSDYIPFYFTPHSPMLLNIKTGYNGITKTPMEDIVILVTSLKKVKTAGLPFLFTDRHAYLLTAEFFSSLDELGKVDWPLLQSRNFQKDYRDPGRFERYQAEALVYGHLPVDCLFGMVCYNQQQKGRLDAQIATRSLALEVHAKPGWFF